MGRTVRTHRLAIDKESSRWHEYRRTLQPWDRERLDRIFDDARNHGDAGTMVVNPRVLEVILVGALIEAHTRIDELEHRLRRLDPDWEYDERKVPRDLRMMKPNTS